MRNTTFLQCTGTLFHEACLILPDSGCTEDYDLIQSEVKSYLTTKGKMLVNYLANDD